MWFAVKRGTLSLALLWGIGHFPSYPSYSHKMSLKGAIIIAAHAMQKSKWLPSACHTQSEERTMLASHLSLFGRRRGGLPRPDSKDFSNPQGKKYPNLVLQHTRQTRPMTKGGEREGRGSVRKLGERRKTTLMLWFGAFVRTAGLSSGTQKENQQSSHSAAPAADTNQSTLAIRRLIGGACMHREETQRKTSKKTKQKQIHMRKTHAFQ